MSTNGPTSAKDSSKKRKRLSTPSVRGDAEAAVDMEKEPKKPVRGCTWKNLDLILSLRDKDVPTNRKIELAFNFVGSDCSGDGRGREPLQAGRVISFMSDWVQPVLISSDQEKSKTLFFPDTCLDYRLWIVLKFCMEKSAINVSHNLLRPVTRAMVHASSLVDSDKDPRAGEDSSGFYEVFAECLSLLFSSHGRSFNAAGLELWVSCAVAAVGLLLKILSSDESSFLSKDKLSALSILMLEQFASFLRFHPSPKNIFRSFVDRLLEPLVALLSLVHAKGGKRDHEYAGSLLTAVENALSNGLCHPAHISGFVSLRSSNLKTEVEEPKTFNESYHRHFFVKLQKIVTEKKVTLMGGLGHVFHLFITNLRNKRRVSTSFKVIHKSDKHQTMPEQEHASGKLVFEVFIQFMEPLFHDCGKFTEMDLSVAGASWETVLMESYWTIRSINDILEGVMREKIYDRTQDSPEGDHCNFLKKVYEMVVIICRKVYVFWLSISSVCEAGSSNILVLIAKELIVSIGYFLEIEYNVVGDDLAGIWLMMLSYLAVSECTGAKSDDSRLTNEILRVGCQMIKMYSDIRQASRPIFALCEAVRFFRFDDDGSETGRSTFFPCGRLSPDACRKAVMTLICSQDLRFATSNAIKSIPEGQAGGCVHQLKLDFTDALGWLRAVLLKTSVNSYVNFHVETEIFGILSEMYSAVLESLSVTASNSIFVGNSINDLMAAVRLTFATFMENHSCNFDNFYISFTGRSLSDHVGLLDTSWVFVCFFRLYVSCRSLYLQVISLMPPDSSKKAASAMGNSFIISSGKDWEGEEGCTAEGYFSWIVNPSISLVAMTTAFSESFLTKHVTIVSPLVYVLNVMALQRLIDLNRQLKGLSYLVQRNNRMVQMRVYGDVGHLPQKQNRKLKHFVKITRQEAVDLTNFMTEFLHLLPPKRDSEFIEVERVGECSEGLREHAWDLAVCSLNERSLPIAIWWLLCQNIDVWCVHASRKSLKKFSSLLVHHWIAYVRNCWRDTVEQETREPYSKHVTFRSIGAEVLKNVAFYEQPVLLRHLASRLSSLLKTLVLPLVSHAFGDDLDLSSLPDWSDVLVRLGKGPVCSMGTGNVSDSYSALLLFDSVSSNSGYQEDSTKRKGLPSLKPEVGACQGLLNLLCKLPDVYIDQRSLTAVVRYILHLERLLVSALLSCYDGCSCFQYDLLNLFVCCRRTLRHLLVTSFKDYAADKMSSIVDVLFGSLSTIQWLLKSVSGLVGLPVSHFGDRPTSEVNMMFFVLMDHTSYLFLALGEREMYMGVQSVHSGEKLLEEPVRDGLTEQSSLCGVDAYSSFSGNLDAWKSLTAVATFLEEETKASLLILRSYGNSDQEISVISVKWNNISCMLSCLQGFLWGLLSAVGVVDGKCFIENTSILSCISELYKYTDVFEEFVDCCLSLSLVKDHHTGNSSVSSRSCMLNYLSRSHFPTFDEAGISRDEGEVAPKIYHLIGEKSNGSMFYSDGDGELHHLRLSLLQSLLKGENPDVGFSIRQIFMSAAALLKLRHVPSFLKVPKSQNDSNYLPSISTGILVTTSDFILSNMTEILGTSQSRDFVWMDGILKYLEVLGSCFPVANSGLSDHLYSKMVDMHLRAMGKCISLQGKAATLASHETVSDTMTLQSEVGECDNYMYSVDQQGHKLNEFKSRLRMSFKELIRKPLRSDIVLLFQTLESVLVGVRRGCNMVYDINTGDPDGGRVSAIVAAGVEFFDLVFDSFSGDKLFGIIKGRVQNLVGSLFNIILHLQSPLIFCRKASTYGRREIDPDPGSTILMCIEILRKFARKNTQLKMDPCLVGQSLHAPSSLFKHFHQLNSFRVPSGALRFTDSGESISIEDIDHHIVDTRFFVDLYAACCRLLCTVVRHQKSETAQCIALLEDSVNTLLTCLESLHEDNARQKSSFVLDIKEAVTCASFLRRVYEEVKQQKDTVRTYACHFLSDYICVYSGEGPRRTGIRREVDEALRPGVYALVDICSAEDFQKLHTILGEGQCRRTLATLRHDYRLYFQYQGKI
ncbi:unnamed protein product [Spirodela intermedia]|uniref:Nucleolar 27S pre-rRNA processing Urb2/Npa2 C-terminal domain-containing protein n=1 Tax=Spirodela intermedia TaxID=51605 RepID=A0A7I8K366_SPIIN|nr:unnamed protein product [Spirodela intermedia]